MIKERKSILGHWKGNRLYLSDQEKAIIIKDYLSGDRTRQEVYEHYTGYVEEHGKIAKWMKQLGFNENQQSFSNFVSMSDKEKQKEQSSKDFELLQLKKRIADLESKLQEAEMKAIAFSTMVDIAEEEFKIPIRKKYNTKPSK